MTADLAEHAAGVVGSPIAHSLSPVLHRAAYQALGLDGWTYSRTEVVAGDLSRHVADLPAHQVGLSVTMPGKPEAVALASEVSQVARQTGAANTLIATANGWFAENTDVVGVQRALAEGRKPTRAPHNALIVGTGATAKSVLVALVEMGVTTAWVQVRRSVRPDFAELAQALDVTLMLAGRDATPIVKVGYAVSTAPGGSEPASLAGFDLSDATVMDVAYGHGPSLWSGQCAEQGAIAIDGSRMLLHQAGEQVRLMTGFDAPLAAMDQALRAAQQGE